MTLQFYIKYAIHTLNNSGDFGSFFMQTGDHGSPKQLHKQDDQNGEEEDDDKDPEQGLDAALPARHLVYRLVSSVQVF